MSAANMTGSGITSISIRPIDVLCGRGNLSKQPGNQNFLEVVSRRKDDYNGTTKRKMKSQIAREILQDFLRTSDPPPRFLTPLEGVNKAAETVKRSSEDQLDSEELWRELDDAEMITKVKMALRQKPKIRRPSTSKKKDGNTSKVTGKPEEASTIGAGIARTPQSASEVDVDLLDIFDFDNGEEEMDENEGNDSELLDDLDQLLESSDKSLSAADKSLLEAKPAAPAQSAPVLSSEGIPQGYTGIENEVDRRVRLPSQDLNNNSSHITPAGDHLETAAQRSAVDLGSAGTYARSIESATCALSVSAGSISAQSFAASPNSQLLQHVEIARHMVRMKSLLTPSIQSIDGHNESKILFELGLVLYEMFAGHKPSQDTSTSVPEPTELGLPGDTSIPKRRKEQASEMAVSSFSYTPLIDLGFPPSLSIMVSNLLDIGHSQQDSISPSPSNKVYRSLQELNEDLDRMVTAPDRYLYDPDISIMTGKPDIRFDSRLYGQDDNIKKLLNAFDRVIVNGSSQIISTSEIVLVAGRSGTGKSALLQNVRRTIVNRGGCFVGGKFDEKRKGQPMSAIIDALEQFCTILLTESDQSISAVRDGLQAAIGLDIHILTNVLPGLTKIVGEPHVLPPLRIGGEMAQKQLIYLFSRFLGVIARPSRPLVLVLDDLQWADDFSLELIRSFLCDSYLGSLLVLGTYRDDEIVEGHPLTAFLRNLMSSTSSANLEILESGNMTKDTVNSLVSDALRMSPRLVEPLSAVIFSQTSGNGLFVVQLLSSLCDEGLIIFSLVSRQWEWDINTIKRRRIADDVVGLLAAKLLKLDERTLSALKIVSCLGSQCDEHTIQYLGTGIEGHSTGLAPLLDIAIEEGLMIKDGTVYSIVHDAIQDAAYCLIPENERQSMHLKIGEELCARVPSDELDSVLFIAVNQMIRGADTITRRDKIIQLAYLSLRAGQTAMAASAFSPALLYLLPAIKLLTESDWSENYNLCLQLYSSAVEACFVVGKYDKLETLSSEVLLRASCPMDKMRVYYSLTNSIALHGRTLDAIDLVFQALAQIGEVFPPNLDDDAVVASAFMRTKSLLQGIDFNDVLQMPIMQDESKMTAMRFLANAISLAYLARPKILPPISARMMEITLTYGICEQSLGAFVSTGFTLCRSPKGVRQGYQLGKVALRLFNRLNARHLAARINHPIYGMINCFVEPLQACAEATKNDYETALSVGDNHSAFSSAAGHATCCLTAGTNLTDFKDLMDTYARKMVAINDKSWILYIQTYSFFAQSLMGEVNDDLLDFRSPDGNDLLSEMKESHNRSSLAIFYLIRMTLAYIFNQYTVAADMAEQRRQFVGMMRNPTLIHETFYFGLVALASSGDDPQMKEEAKNIAADSLANLQEWLVHSDWNVSHKVLLLKAEIASHDGNLDDAVHLYDEAIRVAGEHKFVHEQAIACERCGIFYSTANVLGNMSNAVARGYFARASQYYLDWGATKKAADVTERIKNIA